MQSNHMNYMTEYHDRKWITATTRAMTKTNFSRHKLIPRLLFQNELINNQAYTENRNKSTTIKIIIALLKKGILYLYPKFCSRTLHHNTTRKDLKAIVTKQNLKKIFKLLRPTVFHPFLNYPQNEKIPREVAYPSVIIKSTRIIRNAACPTRINIPLSQWIRFNQFLVYFQTERGN